MARLLPYRIRKPNQRWKLHLASLAGALRAPPWLGHRPGPASGARSAAAPGRARRAAPIVLAAAHALEWAIYLPALAILVLYAWGCIEHTWRVATFPYQIDYGEAPELHRALLLSRGQPIYVDWTHPPYQMANYPPLYPAVAALGVKLAGVQFFTGRLISFASTLATGLLVGTTAWALGAGTLGALAGGLLYFTMYPVWNWGAYQRVDAFAVLLEWLGITVFALGWVRGRRAWAVWATVPLFVAAAYTRQTIAAGAFACYGYLLFRRPRMALGAIAAYATLGLGLFGAFQLATGGLFWRHIVVGNLNRWSWSTVESYWKPFWRLLHWTFPLAIGGVGLGLLQRRTQVPLLYLLGAAATALTIGKIGSSFNYLLQLCAALALAAGLAIGYAGSLARRLAHGRWLLVPTVPLAGLVPAVWLLVGLQQAYHVPYAPEGRTVRLDPMAQRFDRFGFTRQPLWRLDPWAAPPRELTTYYRQEYRADPSLEDLTSARAAQAYLARLEGDIFSEDMSFTVTDGRRIYIQPFEFTQLAEQGEWDQRPLLDDIRHHRFVAVVLRFRLGTDPSWHAQRYTKEMLAAFAEAYRLDATFGSYFIYRPKV